MKTKRPPSFAQLALTALLTFAPLAHAHSVWIEDNSRQQLVIRFGEAGEPFEKSPGLLDQLAHPHAWKAGPAGKSTAFDIAKKSDHFLLVDAAATETAFAESAWPVYRSEKLPGGAKTAYYLRWIPLAATTATPDAKPAHVLDLVPTAEAGVFILIFRGQPLADHAVTVHAPGEKETELKTDAAALVRIPAGKPGVYVIGANHREPNANGFAFGQAYERISHHITTAWRQL